MVLEPAEQQQPGPILVVVVAAQDVFRDGAEHLEVRGVQVNGGLQALAAARTRAAVVDHRPVEALLRRVMAEEDGFIYACARGDLSRRRPLEALAGKETRGNIE